MTQSDQGTPSAGHGLRPRIRAVADDGVRAVATPPASEPESHAASSHAAAFAPYVPAPEYSAPPVYPAPQPVNPPYRAPQYPAPDYRATTPVPAPGTFAGPPVPAASSVPPARPSVPMPVAGRSWEDLLATVKPPEPTLPVAAARRAAAPTPTAVYPSVAAPVFDVSPSALASAPPPTVEPDLEWLREPVPTETGSWSLDGDDDGMGEAKQADLSGADPALVAALQEVLFAKASDLHVTVNAAPTIRVDGGLRPIDGAEVWGKARVTKALQSILTDTQKETFERELELDFAYTISSNARFRVNMYQQRGSIGAAFRLIPTEIKTLKELGIPETVSRFATLARGLVLVTGPTGSGKSTTLAALVDLVNRTRADHIVTVEDPIEFLHQNHKSLVNQREVGPDTHSFGAALKHVLRQDPDVILIGELRDLETISVALTAAETGHLVFATLHTQDAAQTIDRVIDVFPPHQQGQIRTQLAATLQGVVCQTLLKLASGKGRIVATEVLVTTPAIGNLIREGKTYQITSALQAGRELGMYTMDQHLAELVDAGKITHAAAMAKAHDLDSLKRLIHRADPGLNDVTRQMSSGGVDYDAESMDLEAY